MRKIVTIAGARPQFIKAAMVSRALQDHYPRITEVFVHTGQHSDFLMSGIFFDQLGLKEPSHHLSISGGSNSAQVARMMAALEPVVRTENPDAILVYGDTNSTLAGALIASQLTIPLIHVEAGMRSFNRRMPEEINRVITDQLSTLLFAPTNTAVRNLVREGMGNDGPVKQNIIRTGDIMYDAALHFGASASRPDSLPSGINAASGYILCTVHRPVNADDPERLRSIVAALHALCENTGLSVVFPVHPRTRLQLSATQDENSTHIHFCEPFGYTDMLWLEQHASLIITDSGGVQKEAYFFRKPCVILRNETEWTELTDSGAAVLSGSDDNELLSACEKMLTLNKSDWPQLFGDGNTAHLIASSIDQLLA
jgi:UDP-GlcNAc3NAcA epimerase